MADTAIDQDDDETLNLRIQCQEPEALVRLLELYGPIAKGYLKKRYGHVLCDTDIMAVLTNAVSRAWQYGDSYDPSRSLKSWFLRIVQTQAIDMITDTIEHRGVAFDLDRHDRPEMCDELIDKKAKQRIETLERCIEKLEGKQQAIIRADLATDDIAEPHGWQKSWARRRTQFMSRETRREKT